jgi:hypothetical protein
MKRLFASHVIVIFLDLSVNRDLDWSQMVGRRDWRWVPAAESARAGAGREEGQTSAERRGGEDLGEAFDRLKSLIEVKEAELKVEEEKTKIVREDFEKKAKKVEDLKKELRKIKESKEATEKQETMARDSENVADLTAEAETAKGDIKMIKVRLFQAGVHHPAGPPHHLPTLPGSHLLPLGRLQAICPGRQVTALKRRQGGKSKGWTAAKVDGIMVHPPAGGWRDMDYVLFFS